MKRRPDALSLPTAISIVIALTALACDKDRTSIFDADPNGEDAGLVFDAGRDVSESPDPTADGGDGGELGDAGEQDSEPSDSGPEASDQDSEPSDSDAGDGGPECPSGDGCDESCDLAACPEPTYPGFLKCCNSDNECSFKNGPLGFCHIGDSSGPDGGDGGFRCIGDGDCDDGVACTVDACEDGVCRHFLSSGSGPSACPVGQFCDPAKGCVPGIVCANDTQCQEKLGDDPCKTYIYCHQPTATCQYSILDKDGDGHPPIACGGDDCDDSDPYVHPAQLEVCDGKDNDCNGIADDGDICMSGCDIAACPEPPSASYFKCCTIGGTCGHKTISGACEEAPADTCGLASCPEPTYPEFFKCCTNGDLCGYKNGPHGYCYDAEEPDPIDGGGGGVGGSGGGMP